MADVTRICLNEQAIALLKNNGCTAEDWAAIVVTDQFDPELISRCEFKGTIKIGRLIRNHDRTLPSEVGIRNACLENVEIGDDCFISHVHGKLKNLKIGSRSRIINVGEISCDGETSFGNGHEINVLNEAGGRSLPITVKTSAQIAYLTALYRHDSVLVHYLSELASAYAKKISNHTASIGDDVLIQNSQRIINVNIGDGAMILNVTSLKHGTIDSSLEARTRVEDNVIAENFIIQTGAQITSGALLYSTLIGEATKIGKQFSSENSVLFANSEGYHSEICSVFGGPFTVTHHRSTLLIAGYYSFYNAGSGTNQSNHMYKLGPMHQGIMERGCKSGSFSYLLWPSRVGAFSVVLGKHYANFDSSNFPFSYINEEDGKSIMFPGYNIFTVGTYRDALKWRKRDRRNNKDKLDMIIHDILSPYIALRLIRGTAVATDLLDKSDKNQEFVTSNGLRIKRILLNSCIKNYNLALDKYFGSILMRRIENAGSSTLQEILKMTQPESEIHEDWVDLSGLICRRDRIDALTEKLNHAEIKSLENLVDEFRIIYEVYSDDEWNWYNLLYKKQTGKYLREEDTATIINLLERWKEASIKINNLILKDAKWEFDTKSHIGYGIDGHVDEDFMEVRGDYDTNSVIMQIQTESNEIESKFDTISSQLRQLVSLS